MNNFEFYNTLDYPLYLTDYEFVDIILSILVINNITSFDHHFLIDLPTLITTVPIFNSIYTKTSNVTDVLKAKIGFGDVSYQKNRYTINTSFNNASITFINYMNMFPKLHNESYKLQYSLEKYFCSAYIK